MIDTDTADTDTGEEVINDTEPAVKEPLSPEELAKRYDAARRDLREQRQEIRALREMITMKTADNPQAMREATKRAPKPSIDEDPIAYMKWADGIIADIDAADEQKARAEQQANEQNGQIQQIARRMQEYEKDFRDDHPDYDQAAEHYRKMRAEELADEGVSGHEVGQALVSELVSVVARAIRAGKDPAQVVYSLAKKRGFGVDGSSKKLQTIERAQQAGKSLSQTGGRGGDGELTIEYVNTLKGKAFTDGVAKLKAQAKASGSYR